MRRDAARRQQANLRADVEVATLPAREGRTRDLVAELAGASPRTVQDVITVHDHDPELFERVLRNELSANVAASQVRRAHPLLKVEQELRREISDSLAKLTFRVEQRAIYMRQQKAHQARRQLGRARGGEPT